jgi:hypothetical protein
MTSRTTATTGWTPLYCACALGHVEVAIALLNKGVMVSGCAALSINRASAQKAYDGENVLVMHPRTLTLALTLTLIVNLTLTPDPNRNPNLQLMRTPRPVPTPTPNPTALLQAARGCELVLPHLR